MFVARSSLKEKNSTFASFARIILIKLLKLINQRLDLCFDTYKSPSIKDIKRKLQGDRDLRNFYTFGPLQSWPTDFAELLKASDFKTLNWRKVFYCSIDNECKTFVIRTICFSLKRYKRYSCHVPNKLCRQKW